MSSALGENKMRKKITPNTVRGKIGYTFNKRWNTEVGDEWSGQTVNKKGSYQMLSFIYFYLLVTSFIMDNDMYH